MKSKTKTVIIIVSVVIIAIIAVIIGVVIATSGGKSESPQKLLDLGNHYLLELDYEQALVQFERVIVIEPRNPAGYIGAAKAYIGLGEVDKAIEVLRKGLDETGNEDIRRMLEELTAPPVTETSAATTESTTTSTITSTTTTTEEMSTTEVTSTEATTTEELRDLSPYFFGELPIKNLSYEIRYGGELHGNNAEGFLGWMDISIDIDFSSLSQGLIQKINDCRIADWNNKSHTEGEIIHCCRYYPFFWGEGSSVITSITDTIIQSCPVYTEHIGKKWQVLFILMDESGAAIGYCLADVVIPES